MSDSFYDYPEYEREQGSRLPMVLLQVDIAGHSKMSAEFAAPQVMEVKLELAARIEERLQLLGFRGVFWAGDGGMFAAPATRFTEYSEGLLDAWRRIETALREVNDRYQTQLFSGQRIRLRTSAHLASVVVHRYPRYWHSEGVNFFAKHERDIGATSLFRITGTLWRALTDSARRAFGRIESPEELRRIDPCSKATDYQVYEYGAGSGGLRSIDAEMDEIFQLSSNYRKILEARRTPAASEAGDLTKDSDGGQDGPKTNQLLLVVDVQNDFCEGGTLACERTDSLVSGLVGLLKRVPEVNHEREDKEEKEKVVVAFARDWHPEDHASFRNRGSWNPHCVADKWGADYHEKLGFNKEKDDDIHIGIRDYLRDYTPFRALADGTPVDDTMIEGYGTELEDLVKDNQIGRILVVGIALEFCVAATCLDALAHVEEVWALEEYIRPASKDQSVVEDVWFHLEREGVRRVKDFSLERWDSRE